MSAIVLPLAVQVLLAVIAGLSVVATHALGGWAITHQGFTMVNRTPRYRVSMWSLAVLLVVAGTAVGIWISYSVVVGAIGSTVDATTGRCVP